MFSFEWENVLYIHTCADIDVAKKTHHKRFFFIFFLVMVNPIWQAAYLHRVTQKNKIKQSRTNVTDKEHFK